jgi:hypothetical protein
MSVSKYDPSYPAAERQKSGYAIRYIKALLSSDAIREYGSEAILLAIFIASREDRLHYSKAPQFWRSELMDRFGNGSPKGFLRIRNAAIEAGLIHHIEATRTTPGKYWTLVPDWLQPSFEAFRKRNGSKSKRSENGTASGTANGTANGTHSIPSTQYPVQVEPKRLIAPSVEEVKAYCTERGNCIDAEQFCDHYTANGWLQGRGKPIRDWRAAVRTWERNGIQRTVQVKSDPAHKPFTKAAR